MADGMMQDTDMGLKFKNRRAFSGQETKEGTGGDS